MARSGALSLIPQRRLDKAPKGWRRPHQPRAELRVRLQADKKRVLGELDGLDQTRAAPRHPQRNARNAQARRL